MDTLLVIKLKMIVPIPTIKKIILVRLDIFDNWYLVTPIEINKIPGITIRIKKSVHTIPKGIDVPDGIERMARKMIQLSPSAKK